MAIDGHETQFVCCFVGHGIKLILADHVLFERPTTAYASIGNRRLAVY